jgi:YHS domain-containing protein
MARVLLILVLSILVSRMFWRVVESFMEGVRGDASRRQPPPSRGIQMVRDPVCGTFVLPDRAVTLLDGRNRLYFCSAACRDKYRARTA